MNSKERVLAAIDRVEPDRVPVDLWALSPVTDNLRAHLSADDDEGVWRALGVDLRSVWPAYAGPALPTFNDGSWLDWWGLHKRMIGPFEEVVEPPLAAAQTVADIEAHPWPDPDWPRRQRRSLRFSGAPEEKLAARYAHSPICPIEFYPSFSFPFHRVRG